VNPAVLSLAVEVFLNQADTEMLAALSLPRHPDNIPQPVLHERIKVRGTCKMSAFLFTHN
jgi:hypothetical protein